MKSKSGTSNLNPEEAEFAILMCVYNGDKYLSQQLRSILKQSIKNWRLYVSDDGSKDNSVQLVKKFHKRLGDKRVKIIHGPKSGFAKNFMQLLVDTDINADFYALCDQDDIWEKEKLYSAYRFLTSVQTTTPALYCGRTRLVGEKNQTLGYSNIPNRNPSFENALVQNIASGNTMVINNAAKKLLISVGNCDIYAHDWWIYILVSGVGGVVHFDTNVQVRYRQHSNNQIRANFGIFEKVVRFTQFVNGEFSEWNFKNVRALNGAEQLLTSENREIFEMFMKARQERGYKALYRLIKSRVFRQNSLQNFALYIGAIFGRI